MQMVGKPQNTAKADSSDKLRRWILITLPPSKHGQFTLVSPVFWHRTSYNLTAEHVLLGFCVFMLKACLSFNFLTSIFYMSHGNFPYKIQNSK